MENEVIHNISNDFSVAIPTDSSTNELEKILSTRINYLIIHDFPALVHILYRIDVNEKKLEQLLVLHPGTDAGNLLARLVIDRQLAKIKSRQMYRRDETDNTEEERW